MSTYTSEPGTRLAGRYRLVDQVSTGPGWTYWKATDETLARAVTVLTFAVGFPRIAETATAARLASRLSDSRFAQVFDVEDGAEGLEPAFVVLEWVRGDTLTDLLADGPLDSHRAVSLIAEAAAALAAAHRAGQAHLHLGPDRLRWTPGGGVKIVGLGIDAALAGPELTPLTDRELTDTRDLARLLYAALTGYWPGGDGSALPPAPLDSDGVVCTPRQVAAGVPAGIDAVTCRALFQRETRQGPPIVTTAGFADALTALVPPPAPPPALARGPAYDTRPARAEVRGDQRGTGALPASAATYQRRHATTERSATTRAMVSVVIVLVMAAIGLSAWAISRSLHHAPVTHSAAGLSTSSPPSATAAVVLPPASVSVYNVQGNADDPGQASVVISPHSSGAFWHTQYYQGYPELGRLKPGVGLILDMGKRVRLSSVTVQFGTQCCAHVSIMIGDNPAQSLDALRSFTTVSGSTSAVASTTFPVTSGAAGRYVLIWLTYLPPMADQAGSYEAQVFHVTVRGAPV